MEQYIIKDSIDKDGMIRLKREYRYDANKFKRLFELHYINIKAKYGINIKSSE